MRRESVIRFGCHYPMYLNSLGHHEKKYRPLWDLNPVPPGCEKTTLPMSYSGAKFDILIPFFVKFMFSENYMLLLNIKIDPKYYYIIFYIFFIKIVR